MTPAILLAAVLLASASAGIYTADAATLTFTFPALHSDGTPLPQGYTRYEVAYATQSRTWRDSSAVMLADPRAWDRNWPAVVAEAAPVVVQSGWARSCAPRALAGTSRCAG